VIYYFLEKITVGVLGDNFMKKNQVIDDNKSKISSKHKLMIAIFIIIGAILLLVIASWLIDVYNSKKDSEDESKIEFDFYTPNYNENIFENERYSELIDNGFIYYTDLATNLTVEIDRDTAHIHGKEIEFMVEYIYSIIYGDCEAYNSFFSEEYFSENERKDLFTMQKIYDVDIKKEIPNTISEDGETYTKYVFSVQYRILENNGTFRDDFLEGRKLQYITVSDREGTLLIDSISTPKTKK